MSWNREAFRSLSSWLLTRPVIASAPPGVEIYVSFTQPNPCYGEPATADAAENAVNGRILVVFPTCDPRLSTSSDIRFAGPLQAGFARRRLAAAAPSARRTGRASAADDPRGERPAVPLRRDRDPPGPSKARRNVHSRARILASRQTLHVRERLGRKTEEAADCSRKRSGSARKSSKKRSWNRPAKASSQAERTSTPG